MGHKLVIGPIQKGLRQDVTAFNIDNDNFPTLLNAYQWRGRVKRKRGTSLFGRLTRYFQSNDSQFNPGSTTFNLSAGAGNILTGFSGSGIQTTASIVPGSVTIVDQTSSNTYTDTAQDGTLSGSPSGTGTINYASGAITISSGASNTVRAQFNYYPNLPVLGLEPFVSTSSEFAGELGFDQTYSYNISLSSPYTIHSVSFYNNPASATINGISYTQKSALTPLKWNLSDYQQVWTTNYQGALWATPGLKNPFDVSGIGMQFKAIASLTYVSATQLTITITEASQTLVVGDWVFINEVTGTNSNTVNLQTGFVTASANAAGTTTLTVRFPYAAIDNQVYSAGILQYLTNNSDSTKDCLRWYNGSPITSAIPPVANTSAGWVNFCPPLSSASYSIAGTPAATYYLVGARMIIPFKDRLLFLGPVIQTSSSGSQVYLQDTIVYSQNGTPYYTASWSGAPSSTSTYNPLVVPTGETAQPTAFFEDLTGFGGFISAGYSMPIITASPNEDALIVGFSERQARLLYTGNDILPFSFYIINSELGSGATFSSITLDRGVLSVGGRGVILTSQTGSQRVDLDIPDQVFQIALTQSGSRRICAGRDFINEWIQFTYRANGSPYDFPTETLQYNYRDESWAIFRECYTTYGSIRRVTGITWADIGTLYGTWAGWTDAWDSGSSELLQPEVIAGNQQGFILVKGEGTGEGNSLYISAISASSVVTSTNHCLSNGDYIVISGAIGTVSSQVNNKIFSVSNASANSFTLNPTISGTVGTYLGKGVIKRMYIPQIITKQFPVAWDMARKTRIGPQQYLFTKTDDGQVTLLIFLSQNSSSAYNTGSIVPTVDPEPINNSLIYSTVLYTSPERAIQTSNNTPFGSIGDGVLTSFTLNYPSPLVADTVYISVGSVATFTDNGDGTWTTTGTGSGGSLNYTTGVVTITFSSAPSSAKVTTSYQYYYTDIQNPTSSSQSQIWHRMNTSLIGDTVQIGFTFSDSQMRDTDFPQQFSELEFHSAVLDVTPSSLLA